MTALLETWARGLGMVWAGYGIIFILAFGGGVFLLTKKKRTWGWLCIFGVLIVAPFIQVAIWDKGTRDLQPWLGGWSGTIGGDSVTLVVEDVFGSSLSGTLVRSPCHSGKTFFADIGAESIMLMTTDAEFIADLTGDASKMVGTVMGCTESQNALPITLSRSSMDAKKSGGESRTRNVFLLDVFQVNVPNCPTTLYFTLPQDFSPPQSENDELLKSEILDVLHSNTARKAKYSEVFLRDWNADDNLPYVVMGTLGTLLSAQGEYSQRDWASLRKEFDSAKQNVAKINAALEEKRVEYQAGTQANVEYGKSRMIDIYEEGANSLVTLSETRGLVNGEELNAYSAAKVVFVESCIVQVNVATLTDEANTLGTLRDLVSYIQPVSR